MNTKRGITRDHLQHRRKLSVPSPQRPIHLPSTHPPYPLTMESFYRWYAEQGCSTPPRTPNVSKASEKAEATISSESDPDSYYSDYFDNKQPTTIETRSLAVPYISPNHLHTKHILNTPRLDERRSHCEQKRREWRENDLIP
jgi:hypothetical protein